MPRRMLLFFGRSRSRNHFSIDTTRGTDTGKDDAGRGTGALLMCLDAIIEKRMDVIKKFGNPGLTRLRNALKVIIGHISTSLLHQRGPSRCQHFQQRLVEAAATTVTKGGKENMLNLSSYSRTTRFMSD